jgi:hypothetical protein
MQKQARAAGPGLPTGRVLVKARHEIICREGLEQLLDAQFPHLSRKWEEPPTDPPDWYLTLGATRFAVEATSITDQVSVGRRTLPSPSIMNSLAEFVDQIEHEASDEGILDGAYLVGLPPIPNLGEHRNELKSRFLSYIRETHNVESAPEHELGHVGNHRVSIAKLHSNSRYVAEMISLDVKSGHDAKAELAAYLTDVLTRKMEKLAAIEAPKILVVLDAYNYSHLGDWKQAMSSITMKSAFRAVVRVFPPEEPHFIWASTDWLSAS